MLRTTKRFTIALTIALTIAGILLGSPASAPANEMMPYTIGTPIDVELTAPISSAFAHVGDKFFFRTVADVNLGRIVLPAGTPGAGRLAFAEPSSRGWQGEVALQADTLGVSRLKVFVNIDPTLRPHAHLSRRRDMVLNAGTMFRVTTIVPRLALAPLVNVGEAPMQTAEK